MALLLVPMFLTQDPAPDWKKALENLGKDDIAARDEAATILRDLFPVPPEAASGLAQLGEDAELSARIVKIVRAWGEHDLALPVIRKTAGLHDAFRKAFPPTPLKEWDRHSILRRVYVLGDPEQKRVSRVLAAAVDTPGAIRRLHVELMEWLKAPEGLRDIVLMDRNPDLVNRAWAALARIGDEKGIVLALDAMLENPTPGRNYPVAHCAGLRSEKIAKRLRRIVEDADRFSDPTRASAARVLPSVTDKFDSRILTLLAEKDDSAIVRIVCRIALLFASEDPTREKLDGLSQNEMHVVLKNTSRSRPRRTALLALMSIETGGRRSRVLQDLLRSLVRQHGVKVMEDLSADGARKRLAAVGIQPQKAAKPLTAKELLAAFHDDENFPDPCFVSHQPVGTDITRQMAERPTPEGLKALAGGLKEHRRMLTCVDALGKCDEQEAADALRGFVEGNEAAFGKDRLYERGEHKKRPSIVRLSILRAVGHLGRKADRKSTDVLRKFLKAELDLAMSSRSRISSWGGAAAAARALGQLEDESSFDLVLKVVRNAYSSIHKNHQTADHDRCTLEALGGFDKPEAVKLLEKYAFDSSAPYSCRLQSQRALLRLINPERLVRWIPEYAKTNLFEVATRERFCRLLRAYSALADTTEEDLRKLLPLFNKYGSGLEALAAPGHDKATAIFEEKIRGGSKRVRGYAYEGLARTGTPRARSLLRRAFLQQYGAGKKSRSIHANDAPALLRILFQIGDKEIVALVRDLIEARLAPAWAAMQLR